MDQVDFEFACFHVPFMFLQPLFVTGLTIRKVISQSFNIIHL